MRFQLREIRRDSAHLRFVLDLDDRAVVESGGAARPAVRQAQRRRSSSGSSDLGQLRRRQVELQQVARGGVTVRMPDCVSRSGRGSAWIRT